MNKKRFNNSEMMTAMIPNEMMNSRARRAKRLAPPQSALAETDQFVIYSNMATCWPLGATVAATLRASDLCKTGAHFLCVCVCACVLASVRPTTVKRRRALDRRALAV